MATQLLLIRGDEEMLVPLAAGAAWVQVADLQEQGWQIAPDDKQPAVEPEPKPKVSRHAPK